jgi:ribosomal protein S18 acetylase RimI-like enzyme
MTATDCIGPVLTEVAPGDEEGLRLLFQEQRARISFVQQNEQWGWFGGVPFGFGPPLTAMYGLVLALAIVAAMAATLLTAGFTRGPVLWMFAGLVPLLWLLRQVMFGRHVRATLRFYRRARLVPAVIVARTLHTDPPDDTVWDVFAVLSKAVPDAKVFAALVAAGDRLRAGVEGAVELPAALAPVVATIRAGGTAKSFDGSRAPLPRELGDGLELARVFLPPVTADGKRHESRLVFLLVDPDRRTPGHARACAAALWGDAGVALGAALPFGVQS